MANTFGLHCPHCKNADKIDVAALIWVRLTYDGTDTSGPEDGSHEWDDSSAATCVDCGWIGTVGQLEEDDGQLDREED